MIEKKCYKCKKTKAITNFSKSKSEKDGFQKKCKSCDREYHKANREKRKKYYKEWSEKNESNLKEYRKKYWEENKNERKAYHQKWSEKNKDKIKLREKAYREANKDKIKASQKEYREKNKDKLKKYRKDWSKITDYDKKRYREDYFFKLKKNIRSRVYKLLNGAKSKRTEEILGCCFSQLNLHLNYNNLKEPSHDHIIPLSWAETEEELYALFRWENLQGMEKKDNYSKRNFYCCKQKADNVAKIHPKPELIKQILSRQIKEKDRYVFNWG